MIIFVLNIDLKISVPKNRGQKAEPTHQNGLIWIWL